MRRHKGALTTTDTPHCCECKEPFVGIMEFGHIGASDLSGAVEVIECGKCGVRQFISPSIEWKTWEGES